MCEATEGLRNELSLFDRLYDEIRREAGSETEVCDECGVPIAKAEYARYLGLCESCWQATHFQCKKCGELYLHDEVHPWHPQYCENCGDAADRAACERLRELTVQIIALADKSTDYRDVKRACEVLEAAGFPGPAPNTDRSGHEGPGLRR